mgnify:FL=1
MSTADPRHNFRAGFWRLADPKISLASFAGLWLAACFAARDAGLHWGWLALTIAGVFLVEVAKNASGEVVDFDSGTDLAINDSERSPFSGGKRVMVDGLLSREQTWGIAAVCYLLAIAIGLAIAGLRDSRVLIFGLPGMALAWYYHGGSVRLAYRGLGELAVAVAYGPLVVLGAYFVQTGQLSATLLHLSCILGLLVAAFLWINQFPDYRADLAAGKRNLVVRLGTHAASSAYVTLLAAAYLWLLLLVLSDSGAAGVWLGLLGLPPALFSAHRLLQNTGDVAGLVPAQAAALASFCLMAFGSGLGYLLLG